MSEGECVETRPTCNDLIDCGGILVGICDCWGMDEVTGAEPLPLTTAFGAELLRSRLFCIEGADEEADDTYAPRREGAVGDLPAVVVEIRVFERGTSGNIVPGITFARIACACPPKEASVDPRSGEMVRCIGSTIWSIGT